MTAVTAVEALGFGVGFRIETPRLRICSTWPAAFVDSGFGESGLSGLGPQHAPASFASVVLKDGTTVLTAAWSGARSEGCLDVHAFAKPGPGGWTINQISLLQRGGATVDVRAVAPAFRSQSPGHNFDINQKRVNSSQLTVSAVVHPGASMTIAAQPTVSGLDAEDVARAAAVVGRALRAGLPLAAESTVNVFAGDGCNSAGLATDSCASDNTLFVGPAPSGLPPQSQSKFIVAHEFGHVLQFVAAGNTGGEGYPVINGLPDECETGMSRWRTSCTVCSRSNSREMFARRGSRNSSPPAPSTT